MTSPNKTVFLDELRAGPLLLNVLRWILGKQGPLREGGGELFVLYRVSPGAKRWVAGLRRLGLPLKIHELDHDFFDDVTLPEKIPSLQETYFRAAPALVDQIERSDLYQETVRNGAQRPSHEAYLRVALSKKIYLELSAGIRSTLIAEWFFREKLRGEETASLYLSDRGLLQWLGNYAVSRHMELHPLESFPAVDHLLRDLKRFLRHWREAGMIFRNRSRLVRSGSRETRVAVEMYFNGIRAETLYNTDLFWWKPSLFPEGSLLAYFAHPGDQPTPERRRRLFLMGIECLDRNQVRCLLRSRSRLRPVRSVAKSASGAGRVFTEAVEEFYEAYERWTRFFSATGTRLHVSSSDRFPQSEALHASLKDLGGISVSLQRSIEFDPRFYRRTVVDVHFGFARDSAESEALSGSQVRQFVTAGYPFDGVFPLARTASQGFSEKLRSRGATFLLCFFDENRGFDPKRFGARKQNQADYNFLCDRLEEDSTLGLILKPKRPQLLAESLGPVWFRLKGLIESGRCLYLGGNGVDERYLPCAAAAAADAVINFIDGGTAGLESALLGRRVFLIRRAEDPGLFDRLPPGSVIFEDWNALWRAIQELRSNPNHPALGCWEPVLDRLVSFRDGNTAERIHGYLKELWKAFQEGRSREEALERAARFYEDRWGAGWIRSIEQPFPSAAERPLSPVPRKAAYADA